MASRRGFLVPVANPEGVAPLMAVAFAANLADDPPPKVIALVNRAGVSGVESAHAAAPVQASPALGVAMDYARARSFEIEPLAVWSDDPSSDIIASAQSANAAWLLLGYHRGSVGRDTMGGVVEQVFAKSRDLPLNVAVFIQGTDHPFERVFAAVDASADGQAALDLALRIAQRGRIKLRALLVSSRMPQQEEQELVDLVRDARSRIGRLLHTDVLSERTLKQLFRQTPGRLLIVGRKVADDVGLPLDEVPGGGRCVIVVQGAENPVIDHSS